MSYRVLLAVCTGLLIGISGPVVARDADHARIGLLVVAERPKPVAAFRRALKELGYIEGKNLVIEYRSARGKTKRLPSLARELIEQKVDIIVTHSTPGIRAVRNATTSIPIVMASVGNAVDRGFVASVSRPGGNVTGNSFFGLELAVKRIELLKAALPSISKMALLAHPSYPVASRNRTTEAIESKGMTAQIHFADGPAAFEKVFASMKRQGADGLQVLASPVFHRNRGALVKAAKKYGIPAIYPWRTAIRQGGLMSYGHNLEALFGRAALFVDKILKGGSPANLPVERPTKFDLVINIKTAKSLGVTIPRSILLRADEVIE